MHELIGMNDRPKPIKHDPVVDLNVEVTIVMGRIIVDFGAKLTWISMTPEQTLEFAETLRSKALAARG